MKYYLALTLSIIAFSVKAQYVELKEIYEKETIYLAGNGKFSLNGQIYKIKDLDMYTYKFPDASAEYDQYLKKLRNGALLNLLSLGLAVSAFTQIEKNEAVTIALLGGSVISAVFTIRLANQSTRHLFKSVWLYNRDVLGEYY